jgi:hypothetical protein
MASSFSGKRNALVLPAVLLTIAILQEIVTYKLRQHVQDVHVRIVSRGSSPRSAARAAESPEMRASSSSMPQRTEPLLGLLQPRKAGRGGASSCVLSLTCSHELEHRAAVPTLRA